MFNGMFGKVANGMCRLSMNGGIAVKTTGGYKTYDLKTNRLTNCDNFVFNIGEEFFFVIPTNKVEPGDIILVSGKPKCVISNDSSTITVINYENSAVENILPERHVFMGNTYFYGKIVSMFGSNIRKGKKGMNKMMSYMMMSEMMKSSGSQNNNDSSNNMLANMAMMSMMGGKGFSDMFDGVLDFDENDDDAIDEENTDRTEE